MALNATNFVNQGPIRSADMRQFVDLFTGVMIDQPVTFRNALMIGGNQGTGAPPLKVFGVTGQSGTLLEVYPTGGATNPTLGVGALGAHTWGTGAAGSDTSLSRIALQNGHASDTPGILISPYLEVAGAVQATAHTFPGGAQISSPSPFLLQVTGHLQFNPDNTYDIGQTNQRPRNIYAAGAVGTKTKGGIPNDGDVTNPVDGMLAVDTANHAFYFRSANTWRQVSGGSGGGTATTVEEEFVPTAGSTVVTVAQQPTDVWVVSRNGLVQSEASGHYSWMSNSKVLNFADPFTGTERLIVAYCIGSMASGNVGPTSALHEEFKPANAATTVVLSQPPQVISMVAREGVIQSATDGNYSLAGNTLTFTDAFNGTERVVVDYASTAFSPLITGNNIANGSITNPLLAGYPWGNADLKADTARRNLLTNGGFEIWQRGNGPFSASGSFSADRWQVSPQGTDTLSVSRDTANADGVVGACAACTYTKGTGTTTTLLGTIALSEFPSLKGRTVTLSIRVKTSTANAARAFVQVDGTKTDGTLHSGGGQYETLTVTVAVGAGASGLYYGVLFSAACTAYVDNAMLVVGSVAADYQPLHPADDMARCKRYYEVIAPQPGLHWLHGYAPAGSTQPVWAYPIVEKAVTPTGTKFGNWQLVNASAFSVNGVAKTGVSFVATSIATGMTGGYPIDPSAFFTFESNP